LALIITQPLGEADDLHQVGVAAEDRHGHDRQYRADVERTVAGAWIGNLREGLVQRLDLMLVQGQNAIGITLGALPAFDRKFHRPQ
jgi:hypothetical protein